MKRVIRSIKIYLCKQYIRLFAKRYFAGKEITEKDTDTLVHCCEYLVDAVELEEI